MSLCLPGSAACMRKFLDESLQNSVKHNSRHLYRASIYSILAVAQPKPPRLTASNPLDRLLCVIYFARNLRYHFVERSYGKTTRSIRLPDTADTSKASAAYANGVLKLNFPKREPLSARRLQIPIGDGEGAASIEN